MDIENTLFNLPEHILEAESHKNTTTKPRLKLPVRNQVEFTNLCLDDCLPEDHKARLVWDFVTQLDLSSILGEIKSVESHPGAPAIDPKILFALWLYAFIEGINSAGVVSRYCEEHIAFKWICGGVKVNNHTISDFRSNNTTLFNSALTQSIGILSHEGIINLERVAQDGIKVKANAGDSSYRRKTTLEKHLKLAEEYIKQLDAELEANPNRYSTRQASAKKRAAEERVQRVKKALNELQAHASKKNKV